MKIAKYLLLLLTLCAPAALAQTTTWKAADNPHIISNTYTVPAGQTLVLEAGVVVEIKANGKLQVFGQVIANGTSSSRVVITGAGPASGTINIAGLLDFAFTDVRAQVTPESNGSLLFEDCNFSGAGTVFNGTVLQLPPSRAPYLQFDRCAFLGDGTYSSASLYVAYATVVLRNTSFSNASYCSVSPSYLFADSVTSTGSTQFGLQLGSDSDLFLNNITVTNSTLAGLILSGDTRNGSNVLIGPNVTLQGNQYPVHLTVAGLYPESAIPATGNVNNSIHATGTAGVGGHWPKFAIPYYVDASPLSVGKNFRIHPGVIVNMAISAYMNDDASADGMRAYGTATSPIIFQRANPAQAWYNLFAYRAEGGRMRHVIVDGSSDGVAGGMWRLENCIFRNNGIGTNGTVRVSGSQYLNNGTGHFSSGNLNSPTNPNTIQGNGVGVNYAADASNVWWGSPTGPMVAGNPGGTGDKITNSTTPYKPFLTTAPSYADTPPEVTLQRPSFQADPGSKITLRWDSKDDAGIVSHKILFSAVTNTVSSFSTVATLSGDARTYEWTVPAIGFQTAGQNAFIKVVAVDATGKEGFDEWEMLIPTNNIEGSVEFSMTAGQTFLPGEMLASVFTKTGISQYLTQVEYYIEEISGETRKLSTRGANLEGMPFLSADSLRYVIAYGDTTNNRKYWYSPLFKVRPDSRLGDAPPVVSLVTPAAGATFAPGDIVPINWTASDDEGLRFFDIVASFDGARTWQPIVADLPGTARSFNWPTAPGTGSSDVRVMVIAKDLRFQSTSDGASRVFSTNGGGPVTDTVTISRATYSSSKARLTVLASSSAGSSAVLTVYNTSTNAVIGTLPASGKGNFPLSANPLNITVKSSLGGSATLAVRSGR